MASYTDTLPQFAPYVPEINNDLALKVGMAKQQQYEQGIQRIQSNIDNVAGLDIANPVQKQYLQSKLNELGSNLKWVGAGDFSDFQLVNSVNGMTNQIGKDPDILNAVASTAKVRKGYADMEAAKKEGKSSIENEVDYGKQVNGYIQDKNLKASFNGGYTPYIDVNKKLYEIAKEVGIDEKTIQQLYQTDDQGNVLKDKNGVPKWNPVMVEKHLKGKDAGKILSAFQNALTPSDYNQLAITGRYVNGTKTPEELQNQIVGNYDTNIKLAEGKLQDIGIQLYKENLKNDKDENLIESLNKQKEYFENQKNTLFDSRDKDLKNLASNPDGVRASLYTNNYLSTMSHSLSSMTEETKNSVSPLFTITMETNRFNRDLQRDKIADQHWAIEERRKDRKEIYDQSKDQLELFLKYGYGTPPPGYKGNKGIDEPISISDDKFTITNAVREDYDKKVVDLNQKNYDITFQYFKEANPQKEGESEQSYENRIKKAMSYYAFGKDVFGKQFKKAESVDINSGEINSFTARFAAKQIQDWKVNPENIPYEFRDLISSQYDLTKTVNIDQKRIKDIKQQAINVARQQGLDVPSEQEIKKNIKETTINVPTLGTIKLSKDDVIDYTNMHPEVFNTFGSFTIDKNQEKLAEQSRKRQELKYGKNYKDIETKLFGITTVSSDSPLGGTSDIATHVHPVIKSAGSFILNSNYGKIAEIESKLYVDKGFIKQPKSFPLQRGKENKDDVNARITSIISKYSGNLNEQEGFNTEDMIATALSDKFGAIKFTATPGLNNRQPTLYSMTIYDNKGKAHPMKINENDFTYLSKQPPLVNQDAPQVIQQLNIYGTTGVDGTNNPQSAWFSHSDFNHLKNSKYKVTANYVEDKNNKNLLYFRMFVHQPNGEVKTVTYDQPISKFNTDGTFNQALDKLPQAIYPATIDQLLKTKK